MTAEQIMLKGFELALSVGAVAAWFTRGSQDEDEMTVQAHELVLGMVSDADATGRVEAVTDRNWRDDISIEQAEELNRERELRNMKNRN